MIGNGHICQNCGKICTTDVSLRKHVSTNICKSDFKCDKCDKQFTSHKQYMRHMRTHRTKKEKIPCPQCGKMLENSKSTVENHIKVVHEGKCQYCDFVVLEKNSPGYQTIKEHLESNHRNFKCDQCFQGNYCNMIKKNFWGILSIALDGTEQCE